MNRYLWIAVAVAVLIFAAVVLVQGWRNSSARITDLQIALKTTERELVETQARAAAASRAALQSEEQRIQERENLSAKIRDLVAAAQIAESGRRRSETQRRELEAEMVLDIERLPELPAAELAEAATLLMRELYPALPAPEIRWFTETETAELNHAAAIGMQSAMVEVASRRQREGLLLQELQFSRQALSAQEDMIQLQRQEIAAERLRGDRWRDAWSARGDEVAAHEERGRVQAGLIKEYQKRERRRKLTLGAVGVAAVAAVIVMR